MNHEDAKRICEEAELIDPTCEGDYVHYRRVARLLAEVEHARRMFAYIARDAGISIVGYDGTRYEPDGMLYANQYEVASTNKGTITDEQEVKE
jgi:hypothetical protein